MPRLLSAVVAILLIIAIFPTPYAYFVLMKPIAQAAFVWLAYVAYKEKHKALPWVFGVLAFIFSPLEFRIPREGWSAIYVFSVIMLLVSSSQFHKCRQHFKDGLWTIQHEWESSPATVVIIVVFCAPFFLEGVIAYFLH